MSLSLGADYAMKNISRFKIVSLDSPIPSWGQLRAAFALHPYEEAQLAKNPYSKANDEINLPMVAQAISLTTGITISGIAWMFKDLPDGPSIGVILGSGILAYGGSLATCWLADRSFDSQHPRKKEALEESISIDPHDLRRGYDDMLSLMLEPPPISIESHRVMNIGNLVRRSGPYRRVLLCWLFAQLTRPSFISVLCHVLDSRYNDFYKGMKDLMGLAADLIGQMDTEDQAFCLRSIPHNQEPSVAMMIGLLMALNKMDGIETPFNEHRNNLDRYTDPTN